MSGDEEQDFAPKKSGRNIPAAARQKRARPEHAAFLFLDRLPYHAVRLWENR
jgi:hypothetical protein